MMVAAIFCSVYVLMAVLSVVGIVVYAIEGALISAAIMLVPLGITCWGIWSTSMALKNGRG